MLAFSRLYRAAWATLNTVHLRLIALSEIPFNWLEAARTCVLYCVDRLEPRYQPNSTVYFTLLADLTSDYTIFLDGAQNNWFVSWGDPGQCDQLDSSSG